MHSLIFPYKLANKRYIPVIPLILYGSHNLKMRNEKFIADIAFSEKLNIGFNLLGRKGIFEYFDEIAFNEKRKQIIFRYKKA